MADYIVSSGMISSGIILENNSMTVLKGGTATTTTINYNGILYVSSGGTANSTTVISRGYLFISSGGTANSTVMSDGSMFVRPGGLANSTTVNDGYLNVSSGGTAMEIMENGGYVDVDEGANVTFVSNTLSGLVLSAGATIHSGTTANSITVNNGGLLIVFSGATANSTTVNPYSYLYVSSGGTANRATVNEEGWIDVYSGGVANSITVNGGLLQVASGGMTNSTTVNSGGRMYVYSGGLANSTTVNDGGRMYVYSGGTATDIVWTPCEGYVYVSGGYATFVSKYSGVYYGSGNKLLSNASIMDAKTLDTDFEMCVMNGGVANSTTVNRNGNLYISSCGTANSIAVNPGGMFEVSSGGTANSTTVNDSGYLFISSGGTATGQMIFEDGAIVSAYSAILDFNISELTPEAEARVNNLSIIRGTPLYALTVSDTQATGMYTLADGAAGFNGTITVMNTSGDELGTFMVGETVTIGETDYTLNLADGTLSVEIVSSVIPIPKWTFFSGDFNNDGTAMLAVKEQNGNTVTIYSDGASWGAGLVLDPGWEIAGVGDFSGDGLDDFLRVNDEGYVVGEMSNGNCTFSPQVLNFLNEGWNILGTGNFDADGVDDVLIANPTAASETVGLLGYWKGGTEWTLINGYSPEWECVATGDFNADGKCDMLWRNSFEGEGGLTYNAYCTWIVNDPVDWRMVSVANPDEWTFLCSGDFNGDKMNDIAMINDVGVVGIWGVNDGYLSSWSILSAVTSEWQLAGVADFNGDGTDDIAWCNTDTGLVGCWQIKNKELAGWQTIANIG